MKTKVRVKRVELLKLVEGRARKAEAEYKRAAAAYPKKVETWEAECVARLERALAAAQKGNFPTSKYGYREVKLPDQPEKPSEGRELCNLRRMLATLKIGSDDTLLLSQDDADEYFGPCKL